MFRIRFHGRGGQGVDIASRALGAALFEDGYVVQDTARALGAADQPVVAQVRASRATILERGPIEAPDLVVLVDDTLRSVAAARIIGRATTSVLLASQTHAATWADRLDLRGPVHTIPRTDDPGTALACAAAAARLLGLSCVERLQTAIRDELVAAPEEQIIRNLSCTKAAWENLSQHAGTVRPSTHRPAPPPSKWVMPEVEELACIRAPDTVQPKLHHDLCQGCTWICRTACPNRELVSDTSRPPRFRLPGCVDCTLCAALCPHDAIELTSTSLGGPS